MPTTRIRPVIDLHTHSVHSDGTQTPWELVQAARRSGVDVLGLTDHDVVDGWDSAATSAAEAGITLVPGVELSTQIAGMSVHLLAYLVDPHDRTLVELMSTIRSHRSARFRRTVDLLVADGYALDYKEILARVGPGTTLGRPHVADALVRSGSFPDRNAAFERVLHSRSRYSVPHWAPPAHEAIEVILAPGGCRCSRTPSPTRADGWSRRSMSRSWSTPAYVVWRCIIRTTTQPPLRLRPPSGRGTT